MLKAHGTMAHATGRAIIQISVSIVTAYLPNHLDQHDTRVRVQPVFLYMELDDPHGSLCVFGGVLIDVSLSVKLGDDAVNASKA